MAALSIVLPVVAASATALADPPVTRGQFTDGVEGGHPVGEAGRTAPESHDRR